MVKNARTYVNGKRVSPEHDVVEWKPWMSVAAVVSVAGLAILLTSLFFVGV